MPKLLNLPDSIDVSTKRRILYDLSHGLSNLPMSEWTGDLGRELREELNKLCQYDHQFNCLRHEHLMVWTVAKELTFVVSASSELLFACPGDTQRLLCQDLTDIQLDEESKISLRFRNLARPITLKLTPEDVGEANLILSFHHEAVRECRKSVSDQLTTLLDHMLTSFDVEVPHHVESLRLLWTSVYGDDHPIPPIGTETDGRDWSSLGFQCGHRPHSDFRGSGLLALHCLNYFAAKHPAMVRGFVEVHCGRRETYPFAAAGINLSQLIVGLLLSGENVRGHEVLRGGDQVSSGERRSRIVQAAELSPLYDVFVRSCLTHRRAANASSTDMDYRPLEELFCAAFMLLEQMWVRFDATYMDFPKVMTALRRLLTDFIASRPESIEDLSAWELQAYCN
eukprot:Rmarinus@m.17653